MSDRTRAPDPWPQAPALPGPVVMDQQWTDAVFVHWRLPASKAATFMPPGVIPDIFDGSSWVGLVGFRMRKAGLGRGPAIPFFGNFIEVNVRLYSRGPDGTRGVVFLSLDANRLAVVLAARAVGIPYVWSRAGFHRSRADGSRSYAVRRFGQGAKSHFSALPTLDRAADPLSVHLTARFGLHTRFGGRTFYVPNTHAAWPLYRAELTRLDDELVRAAGIDVAGPPDSVLCSPGVRTQFGRPRALPQSWQA